MSAIYIIVLLLMVTEPSTFGNVVGNEEERAKKVLEFWEIAAGEEYHLQIKADWNYQTNITVENEEKLSSAQLRFADFNKILWKNITSFNWRTFKDKDLYRRFKSYSILGVAILSSNELKEYNAAISGMETIYATTKICFYNNHNKCDLNLEPEVTEIMANSRNYDELKHVWKEWHEKSGRPMKAMFQNYVNLGKKAANLNEFKDMGQLWRLSYESDSFVEDVAKLWMELKPFYEQLHAYVRHKLRTIYGIDKVNETGPIPAHLLGNMWALHWNNIYDLTAPFPNAKSSDVTDELNAQSYDVIKMFHTSDEFFTSLGLIPLPEKFWNNSVFQRPVDRELVCHASAWDFYDGKDFRIKMCTEIDMEDFITIHHEMGHIQYFMQYNDQPLSYKDGANPGFHEAVGDTLALSVATPKHLKNIGLLKDALNNYEADINYLFGIALDKIAFLPFGYVIDLWRWQVFEGKISDKDYNKKWWELRKQIQGVVPPITRSEEDFDAGAKYHVAADVPYIRYFVSYIVQFQFYKSLCSEAEQYLPGDELKPLHLCDFYQNKPAGKLLRDMLSLGSSKIWTEAMSIITKGKSNKMDASALIEYFKPLINFLEAENKKHNVYVGWND